jgi:CheY-like chemotaxis protein
MGATAEHRFDPSDIKTLIVGDNAFERRLVQDLLIALGVREIFQAEDSLAAFTQLNLRKPRLIVVDAEMRPTSGLHLVRALRASSGASRNIPLILFTSETSPDFADAALQAGAHEVIAKPVSAQAMRRCVKHAMTVPRAFADKPKPRPAPPIVAPPANPNAKLGMVERDELSGVIEDARMALALWAPENAEAQARLAGAIEKAVMLATTHGADIAIHQALAAAQKVADAFVRAKTDARTLDACLIATKAMLSAEPQRRAMREALADAVSELAFTRAG